MTADCVYLPPAVFACPPCTNTVPYSDVLEQFIIQLTALHERMTSELVRLLVGRDTAGILIDADCYPAFPSLRVGLVEAKLDEIYQTGDVVRIIDQLLRGVEVVENVIDVAAILADPIQITSPIAFVGKPNTHEHQHYQLVALALGQYLNLFPAGRTRIIGQIVNKADGVIEIVSTRVSALIQDIEWNTPRTNIKLPLDIDEQFPCNRGITQVLHDLELGTLNVALTQECMTELISVALLQTKYTGGHSPQSMWSIGSQFTASVTNAHLDNNPVVMRSLLQACVNVICGISMDKTHPLRTGNGGNCAQITRMGANAWRRDIDYEFHLHYWSNNNSHIFASCGTHGCFTIPDPD